MRIAFSLHGFSKPLPSFSVLSDPFDRMSRSCTSARLLTVHLYTQLGMVSVNSARQNLMYPLSNHEWFILTLYAHIDDHELRMFSEK